MSNHYYAWLPVKITLKIFIGCCLALACFLYLSPAQATYATATGSPTLQVDVGFDATYKAGYWTPVRVSLNNDGPDFKGTLSVSTYTGPPRSTVVSMTSPWSFEQPVTLPKGTHKQVTMYVPFYLGNFIPQGMVAQLRNSQGRIVATQASTGGYEVQEPNLFLGLLADPNAGFGPLNSISLLNQTSSLTSSSLDASNMPTMAAVLENFDVIILDNFASSTLSPGQISALRTWINQGGVLIEIGGPQWQRTLGPLPPDMVPVALSGTTTLSPGTHLLPVNGSVSSTQQSSGHLDSLQTPIIASTGTLRTQNSPFTLLASGTTPLIVQTHQGQGVIYYLAFDPAEAPLVNWPGTSTLWSTMLFHAFGEKFLIPNIVSNYFSGPGRLLTHGGVLSITEPPTLLGPWIIVVLLLGYLLVLGPIRLFIVKRLKLPRWWAWRIFVGSAVIFSLLAYGLALYQKGASLSNNSISIIQFNQNSSSAHITTYTGLFVPNQGDFNLHIPGANLTQPVSEQFMFNNFTASLQDDPSTTITNGAGDSNLNLHNLGPWTFHPIISEQDRQLPGGLSTHLALNNNRLVGTISNTLNTPLSDLYVLLSPHSFARIGHLAAGETEQINLPLSNSPLQSMKWLTDQIATQGGLPANYFPYRDNQQPQTDFQHHMALLSALSGAGFTYLPCSGSCYVRAITSRDTIFATGGNLPSLNIRDDFDPLLISGSQATLIGWADQQVAGADAVTVNGTLLSSHHDNFIQMPLNIAITSPLNIPPDFITGHVIGVQSYDAQVVLPGIYRLANGSITFELAAPDINHLTVHGLTITESDLLAHPAGPGSGSTTSSNLKACLYNWRTGSWDAITLNQDTFTTTRTETYIGPGGRVLVQVISQNNVTLYFSKPSLALNS